MTLRTLNVHVLDMRRHRAGCHNSFFLRIKHSWLNCLSLTYALLLRKYAAFGVGTSEFFLHPILGCHQCKCQHVLVVESCLLGAEVAREVWLGRRGMFGGVRISAVDKLLCG